MTGEHNLDEIYDVDISKDYPFWLVLGVLGVLAAIVWVLLLVL